MSWPANDLFGDPVNPRRGFHGRPRHLPTPERRALARALHEAGQSQPKIAAALGITIPTLWRHYADEIESSAKIGRQYLEKE